MKKLLLISYIVLGVILIATLAVGYFDIPYLTSSFVKDMAMNLAAEVTGIGLTVFLIDRVLKKQQEAELQKCRQVALQRLKNPLASHAEFLFHLFKATVDMKPPNDLVRVTDLFNKSFFANVALLDFSKPAPISSALAGSPNWATYLVMETKSLNDALSHILDKYSVYLKVELIEMIEKMIAENFHGIVAVLRDELVLRGAITPTYLGFSNLTEHVVEPHVWAFQELVFYFNSQVDEQHQINLKGQTWRNDVAPVIGSARAPAQGPLEHRKSL